MNNLNYEVKTLEDISSAFDICASSSYFRHMGILSVLHILVAFCLPWEAQL